MKDKEFWIKGLDLIPHPEGGYYKENYRSMQKMNVNFKERNLMTSIYFLLTRDKFSAFHRIKSDELWHFHDGNPIVVHSINQEGVLKSRILGKEIENGQQLQFVVPAGEWFASEVISGGDYSLVGCTVAPGFDFGDFELADSSLQNQFPQHQELIKRLTIKNSI